MRAKAEPSPGHGVEIVHRGNVRVDPVSRIDRVGILASMALRYGPMANTG